MNGTCTCVAPVLPVDVIEQVLMLIDQKQRVQSCALVGRNWYTAAKLTIDEVTCRLGAAAQHQALCSWLCSNSSQITSIEVCSKLHRAASMTKLPKLQLPLCELQQLQTLGVEYCQLQPITTAAAASNTAATAAHSASLAALNALRTLKLESCVLNAVDLGRCTSLQHLHLSPALPTNDCRSSDAAMDLRAVLSLEASLAIALLQLQQLTFLSVNRSRQEVMHSMRFSMIFRALSGLPQLQVLEVGSRVDMPAYCFADLPISLRRLKISSFRFGSSTALPLDAAPHLHRLSNLQHLHLHNMTVEDPQLLLSCTQLTGLDLTEVKVEVGVHANPDDGEEEALISLLAVLQHFQQLRHLGLSDTLQFQLYEYEPYAAVTASSHLTSLDLDYCCIDGAAVENIFAAAQPCRGLMKAKVTSYLFDYPGSYQMLVACCPALQYLDIYFPWDDVGETDLEGISALTGLTGLTSLRFGGLQLSDDAMASIAQCQQLKDLGFVVDDVSLEGLQHLTRLTGLTRLSFRKMYSEQPDDIYLLNQAAAGCSPDVHQQLKSHLEQQQEQAAPPVASSE